MVIATDRPVDEAVREQLAASDLVREVHVIAGL
jgi:hypothetical protein